MKYTNIVLTVIAVLLTLIVAKLYLPALQEVGPRLAPYNRADLMAARAVTDPARRKERLQSLRDGTPIIWVVGGDIDASGSSVEVSNTVNVEGDVSTSRNW